MKHSSPQEISPDELIRQKVVSPPDPIDPKHFPLPPDEKITVIPPIIDNENDSSSAIERLLKNPSTVASQVRKQRRFCGIRVPLKYSDYSGFALFCVWFRSKRSLGTFISLLLHILLFLILATIVITVQSGTLGRLNVEMAPEMGDLLSVDLAGDAIEIENTFDAQKPRKLEQTPLSHWELDHPTEDFMQSLDVGSITAPAEKVIDTESSSGGIPILQQNGSTSSRTEENRIKGIPGREGDTTKESEDAVERGLSWLAAHQWPDGSWAFDLNSQDRTGQTIFCDCINSKQNTKHHESYRGNLHPSRTAATALALLPFLGAGYTHQKENKYRQVVNAGLDFLKYQSVETDAGLDFRSDWAGQGMYIQGITALTLCEAYEMTGDKSLRPYAQGAIRFIESAQRPDDGGWRYHIPTENLEFYKDATGDTTITGWQMMALKSAISAGLAVQPSTFYRVSDFLELVQVKDGSQYKYIPSTNETEDKLWSTTAVGLLIRLYLGWNRQYPAFRKGIDYLTQWLQESNRDWLDFQKGKTSNKKRMLIDPANQAFIHNLYFSYYAILVLHLSDSSEWHPAFAKMREFLIQTQSRGLPGDFLKGHSDSGSWLFSDIYLNDGGRLLYTVLSLLILETPYRYLPMYSEQNSLP